MHFISSDNLKPGMILAMDLTIYNNYNFKSLLLREGQELNTTYINKICSNNISGAYIKNEASIETFSNNTINEEFEADILTRIKDIFYKYKLESYKFNQKLFWQISDLADDLIKVTILNKYLSYKTLEYKNCDDYIFQHCLNVAILSISLGNSMNFNPHMLHELAITALLHDLGMMHVPVETLDKNDKLTEEEMKIINLHPVIIVKEIKNFVSNDVLRGITSHHENVNGTGYPYKLSDNQIHTFGKILSICDAFQALNTDFTYRKAWSPDKIVKYINENKDIKYNSDIAEIFLRNIIVYPPGDYVKLNNRKSGIVIKHNPENCLKPIIKIINPDDSLSEEINLFDNENDNLEIIEIGHNFKYIVSACLCGEKTRYDGKVFVSEKIKKLVDEGKAIMICPEVMGGLKVPRLPCEIKNGRVINITSDDKTSNYVDGAIKTLETAQKYNITKAILKEKSPSCGSNFIYDGEFTKKLIHGEGITTRLLRLNNIEVISDEEFEK